MTTGHGEPLAPRGTCERIRGAAAPSTATPAPGCDDQFEFELALDLLLHGFDNLHRPGRTSHGTLSWAGDRHSRVHGRT